MERRGCRKVPSLRNGSGPSEWNDLDGDRGRTGAGRGSTRPGCQGRDARYRDDRGQPWQVDIISGKVGIREMILSGAIVPLCYIDVAGGPATGGIMHDKHESRLSKTVSFIIEYTVAILFLLGILWFFLAIGASVYR